MSSAWVWLVTGGAAQGEKVAAIARVQTMSTPRQVVSFWCTVVAHLNHAYPVPDLVYAAQDRINIGGHVSVIPEDSSEISYLIGSEWLW
jgi:hypothetical protein